MKLYEKYLGETTVVGNYPDTGGIASDDDMPPGNINYGSRYERKPYHNRLTGFKSIWDVDDEASFTWDWFENSTGMEDTDNYSDTLKGPGEIVKNQYRLNFVTKHVKPKSDTARAQDLEAMNKEVPDEPLGDDPAASDNPVQEDVVRKIGRFTG